MKKHKHCPECGTKTRNVSNFCGECGYEVAISEVVEDKKHHIRKAQEIIESESPIDVPKKLTLMPGERLLERHVDYYVSNKRLIYHLPSVINTKTVDYHYNHIKGIQEDNRKPFLVAGLIIGIVCLLLSLANSFFFVVGVICIILAFWFKKADLVVMHMDGGDITIPNIKTESGKKVAGVLRAQLYNK